MDDRSSTAAPPARAVILFDLDGTLVDTLPDLAGAANAFLAEHGAVRLSRTRVQAMIGDGLLALAGKVMAAGGVAADDPAEVAARALRFQAIYAARGHRASTIYPDVQDVLGRLRTLGFRLAVCTNKAEAMASELLDQVGLAGLFATIGGGDSFGVRKPDPAHVRGVLARLGARPTDAIMVGDTANDVRAARAAGVRVLVVAHGYGLQGALAAGPEMVVNGFADLPRILTGMFAEAKSE